MCYSGTLSLLSPPDELHSLSALSQFVLIAHLPSFHPIRSADPIVNVLMPFCDFLFAPKLAIPEWLELGGNAGWGQNVGLA